MHLSNLVRPATPGRARPSPWEGAFASSQGQTRLFLILNLASFTGSLVIRIAPDPAPKGGCDLQG